MYDIFGPTRPWLRLVDAVGVALATRWPRGEPDAYPASRRLAGRAG